LVGDVSLKRLLLAFQQDLEGEVVDSLNSAHSKPSKVPPGDFLRKEKDALATDLTSKPQNEEMSDIAPQPVTSSTVKLKRKNVDSDTPDPKRAKTDTGDSTRSEFKI
jgi:hypothetical protein